MLAASILFTYSPLTKDVARYEPKIKITMTKKTKSGQSATVLDRHLIYSLPFHLVRWEAGISSQSQEIIALKQVRNVESCLISSNAT